MKIYLIWSAIVFITSLPFIISLTETGPIKSQISNVVSSNIKTNNNLLNSYKESEPVKLKWIKPKEVDYEKLFDELKYPLIFIAFIMLMSFYIVLLVCNRIKDFGFERNDPIVTLLDITKRRKEESKPSVTKKKDPSTKSQSNQTNVSTANIEESFVRNGTSINFSDDFEEEEDLDQILKNL